MATSAFRSTSRRATASEPKATPPATGSRRRSHSVSAVSRKTHVPFDENTFISTEFSNSRDNPLFWATSSSSPDEEQRGKSSEIAISNNTQYYPLNTRNTRNANSSSNSVSASEHRGRSVTRNFSGKNGIGRSLSRVRRRSVSRAPCGGAFESEKEQDMITSTIARRRNEIRNIGNGINRTNTVRNKVDTRSSVKNAGITKNQKQATEWSEDDSACSLQISNLDDGISIGSFSEAEEKTIKAVCEDLNGQNRGGDMPANEIYETVRSEVRRAIADIQNDLQSAFRKNNFSTVAATNVVDMTSDLGNPEAVELISDIRRECAIKLEESEQRARKLRADLSIEEHRGQELDRILKEILPDPKSSGIQRSRRGRRASNERKRMSKRLTEEAMTYFDECVSLSTFDSSDFSAPEDPPYSSIRACIPLGASSLKESPSNLCCYDQGRSPNQTEVQLYGGEDSELTANSSSAEPESTQLYEFSFAGKKSENAGPQDDFKSYIKNFERGPKKDVHLEDTRSYYDAGEYILQGHFEDVLIDRVMYSSRIDSGGLLLCGSAVSFLPFASVL
ncbi:hypothetical protein CDL12_17585 [Handroanthus impetiginosus]|uniref:Uncharacterized protein n=1 Tax=Handroanthus impetiginosus TaxID=429701 RepID=A0A2G9GX41_9LAMI|nr:hypothetical protein CDL12_17585 [Handroanthus impetiginosus]